MSRPRDAPLRPLALSLNASATAIGNLIYAACQWGLLVLLARLREPAVVGQFALGLAVSGPLMLLASLQLRAVQVTDALHHNHFSEYLALRLTTSGLALILICGAALVIGNGAAATVVIVLVGLTKAIESVSDVYRGRMQQAERMERVAGSMILRGLAALGALALALLLGASLTGALAVVIAADLLVWWSWDVRTAKLLSNVGEERARGLRLLFGVAPRFENGKLIALARAALPLGFVAVLLSLNSYAPQYAIRHSGGAAELGVFAALLFAATASNVLISAVGQSASPVLARFYEAGNMEAFRALHARLLGLGASVGVLAVVGAVLLGEPVLRLIYGQLYAVHADLFILLSAVAGLIHIVSIQGYTVTAARRFRAQFPVSALVAATTLLGAFLWVPRHGTRGAAMAMLAGALVQGAGYTLILRNALQQPDRAKPSEALHAQA
jgi:O-antigen/teichoic acid export membrane protein